MTKSRIGGSLAQQSHYSLLLSVCVNAMTFGRGAPGLVSIASQQSVEAST